MTKIYDVIILGSGPGGCTAAIYSARSNLKTMLIKGDSPGGQLTKTTDVENYPGFPSINGYELMNTMIKHVQNYKVDLTDGIAESVEIQADKNFRIHCGKQIFTSKAIIICTGAEAKWLNLESENFFRGYGVSACATCDGYFYKNKCVAVVGGGDSAAEEALFLTQHAAKVYLIHRRDALRAKPIMQDRITKNPKITAIWNHVVENIFGTTDPKSVTGVTLTDVKSGASKKLNIDCLFVSIGHSPNTKIFSKILTLDSDGYIITDSRMRTNVPGIFAAGDAQDKIYRQAITSAGTGCIAALEAYQYLDEAKH